MTPNGAVIFSCLAIATALVAPALDKLAFAGVVPAIFAAWEVRNSVVPALRRTLLLVLPLIAFLALVWIVVVGRAPNEIAADSPGTRWAAAEYVGWIGLRLALVVAVIQLAIARFSDMTPIEFLSALRLPTTAKTLLALTLSLVETLLHAIDRARTALIAAGVITRGFSLRNLLGGWVLVQTVWLSAVSIVIARIRDKWPAENTMALLNSALTTSSTPLSPADVIWIVLAAGAFFAIFWIA